MHHAFCNCVRAKEVFNVAIGYFASRKKKLNFGFRIVVARACLLHGEMRAVKGPAGVFILGAGTWDSLVK